METLRKIAESLMNAVPYLVLFFLGRTSRNAQQLKDENEKLKQFKQIDDREVHKNEVYDISRWR